MANAVMLQGTGSDVGKTVLVAGLCRLLASRGLRVRPFKPQNMSNNAAVSHDATPGEMGRAQWLQAKAARVAPSVHMNPVLLKPQSETGSQIILQGKVHGNARGRDYQRLKPQLLSAVLESFAIVSADADLVIVEGAGSPAEINLRAGDIANMGFATAANVPVVLIGDIDRGGVIASLVGTHAILDATDRAMIAGYIINKFRGDVSLFDDGLQAITRHTGWPSLGVVPWLQAASRLPAEDSVALERMSRSGSGRLKVAVPLLGRIANFDDLDPLASEPSVDLVYVRPGEPLPEDTALVVLPGSKSTIGDLRLLREAGFDGELWAHHARGGHVVGLCGGYQMLGRSVRDPLQADGDESQIEGLGLLDIATVMAPDKTVRNVRAHSTVFDTDLEGYEIHLGQTTGRDCERPPLTIEGRPDGAMSADGRVFGTYLHGLFGNDAFRAEYLRKLGADASSSSYDQQIETALDAIAERLGGLIDVDALLAIAASRSS